MHFDGPESTRAALHNALQTSENWFKLNNMICKGNAKISVVQGQTQVEKPHHTRA